MNKMFEWLNTPKLKPSAFLAVVLGILYYVFTNTTMFQNLSENVQTLIFIAIIVATTLLGVSITSLKEFGNELNNVIQDTSLIPEEKVHKLTLLAIKVNTQLGLAWESYNLTEQATVETADNTAEIERIKAQLEALAAELSKPDDEKV
jgi:hypothetical protein